MDLKPLIYEFRVLKEDVPAAFLRVSTGSTDNVKPELVMETYCQETGYPYSPIMFEIQREELYDPGFVSLEDLGEIID